MLCKVYKGQEELSTTQEEEILHQLQVSCEVRFFHQEAPKQLQRGQAETLDHTH